MSIVLKNGIFCSSLCCIADASNSLSIVSNASKNDQASSLHWWKQRGQEHSMSPTVNVRRRGRRRRRRRSSTSSRMKHASQAESSSSSLSLASSSSTTSSSYFATSTSSHVPSILQSRALPYKSSSSSAGEAVFLTSPIDQLNHMSDTQYPYSNFIHNNLPDPPARPYVNWNSDAYKPYFDPMPGDTNVTAQLGKSTFLRCRIKQITDEPVSTNSSPLSLLLLLLFFSSFLSSFRAQMNLTMCSERVREEKNTAEQRWEEVRTSK